MTDKIDIKVLKDGFIEKAIASNMQYIKTETLTADLVLEEQLEIGTEIVFDEVNTRLLIKKH